MTLTVRSASITGATTAARALTHAEMDANWAHVVDSANQSFIQSGTGAVSTDLQTVIRSIGKTPQQFGAVGDGVTDDSAAFNLWAAQVTSGGHFWIPPATYLFANQVTVTAPTFNRAVVHAYGAVIKTSGAISGIKISGGGNSGGSTWNGLHINHDANATATAGIDVVGAVNTRLVDPCVEAGDTGASYVAILFRNTDTANDATGAFWGEIVKPLLTKRSGANMAYGIVFRGSSGNAGKIIGGSLGSCATAVSVEIDSGKTYITNGFLVDGVAFESYTTAILVNGAATSNASGYRFVNNRFENGTTVFSFTGTTSQPSVPPVLEGNYLTSNAGTYLNNPNNLYVNSFDISLTPAIVGTGAASCLKTDLEVTSTGGSTFPLIVRPVGGSRGIRITSGVVATSALDILWTGTGNKSRINSTTGSVANLAVNGVQGISGATANTDRNNLRGSVTFASAATAAVTFSVAEPNATYFVALSGSANETFWVTSKGTSGFTLNSSNATSAATVDWVLIG